MNRSPPGYVSTGMRLRSLAFATLPAAAIIAFAAGCGSSSSGGSGAAASVAASSAPAAAAGSGGGSGGGPYGSGGGGAATSAATGGASTGEVTLHIQNFMFGAVTVPAGAKVEVENEDSAPHTVNVNGAGIDVHVAPGGKATLTAPTKAGKYALTCDIHPSMHGSLVVS